MTRLTEDQKRGLEAAIMRKYRALEWSERMEDRAEASGDTEKRERAEAHRVAHCNELRGLTEAIGILGYWVHEEYNEKGEVLSVELRSVR